MNTTDVALQSLIKAKEQLLIEVSKIDKALEVLTGGQPLSGEFQSSIPQFSGLERKLYSKVKLDRLVKEGFKPTWTYPQKIMFLLKVHGPKMYVQDMVDQIADLTPSISDDELRTIKERIGYQAGDLAKVGTIDRIKHGSKVQYILPDYLKD